MATSFEDAKAFLKTGQDGQPSVYDHISELVLRILRDKPHDPLGTLETLSARLKTERLHPEKLPEGQSVVPNAAEKAAIEASIAKVEGLLPAIGEEESLEIGCHVPDLLNDQHLLEWAGVGFGAQQAYQLMLSVLQLAASEHALASVRLFGKVHGTHKDYYIVEAKMSEPDAAPEEFEQLRAESPGEGGNEFVYFVTNQPGDGWTRLPDLIPEQVKVSRGCRRFFSGDLDAEVLGQPRFRWKEASYLRAVVSRIAAATVVSPKGFYTEDEESDKQGAIVEAEEQQPLEAKELSSPENWVHHRAGLLLQGRVKPFVKAEEDEDAEENEPVAEDEPEEEALPILRALDEDTNELGTLWTFRVSMPPGSPFKHAVASARSLTWPGAVAVAKGSAFSNIYVGNGLRQLATPFRPPLPMPFAQEFQDDEDEPVLNFQEDPLPPPVDDDDGDAEAETETN